MLGRNILAPIVFETPKEGEPFRKLPDEEETIQRLRSIFLRAIAKRTYRHDVSGVSIDPEAWITHLATRSDRVDPFLIPGLSRGFRTMLLVDRSTSMKGVKIRQVDYACRVLSQAMSFPFVTFDVWTFRASMDHKSEAIIGRYPQNHKYTCSHHSQVTGTTPLHIAIQAAHNELRYGEDYRSLIVLTDGDPIFTGPSGEMSGTEAMRKSIRGSVTAAMRRGIPTYALIVGSDVSEESAAKMFPRTRVRAAPQHTSRALIRLFTDNFLQYIRTS